VIVVCSGPGLFAGDALDQRVTVRSGARVVLTSQAALQVHPGPAADAAIVRHSYTIEPEAELHCHWDPVIPFAGARLDQHYDLQLARESRVYWSDALMAGRVARGERWRFDTLAHTLRFRLGESLAYLERYRLDAERGRADRAWAAGGATHVGTTVIHDALASADAASALHAVLQRTVDLRGAADLVERRLIVARVLGENGASFAAARHELRRQALETIFDTPELAGRK
jgi:urease accessory protein